MYKGAASQNLPDSPRIAFVSYAAQSPVMEGGPSVAKLAATFSSKGYAVGLVRSRDEVEGVKFHYDVIVAHGV